jgi:hypothetical protein
MPKEVGIRFMRKGAMVLFAFSLFFIGCQAKMVYPPPPEPVSSSPPPFLTEETVLLPDLTLSDITTDEAGRLVIVLSNIGKTLVPHPFGKLKIYVDDDLKWSIPLDRISDQTFLQPEGVTHYTTPVELEGTHLVRAIIDSDEEVMEENESNNVLTRILTYEIVVRLPPPSSSLPPLPPETEAREASLLFPEIKVTDLSLNSQRRLMVTLVNVGKGVFLMKDGTLKIFVDGTPKGSYALRSFSDQSSLQPEEGMTFPTSLTLAGHHEVYAYIDTVSGLKEKNQESLGFRKMLESLPIGPDIIVKELELTEDFELSILLTNAGEGELRKGTTLGIRVYLNDQKVSEFDHLISESLRPLSGNGYVVDPPYRIRINGTSKVRVSIWPKGTSDDFRLDNNTIERYFVIYPFKIKPQKSEEFRFFPLFNPLKQRSRKEKVRTEVRWDGGGYPLRLSLIGLRNSQKNPVVSGRSPLRLEVAIEEEKDRRGQPWRISVANLMEKKVEGTLIIQTP